jgi:hypothetical protein
MACGKKIPDHAQFRRGIDHARAAVLWGFFPHDLQGIDLLIRD